MGPRLAARRAGELGPVWPLSRPVVYHDLDRLQQDASIEATGIERGGRGPHRVVYDATPRGRKDLGAWLATPVERVREMRSLFLAKVMLGLRTGRPVESLLVAQRGMLGPLLAFRLEAAGSAVRLIDGLLESLGHAEAASQNGST